MAGTSDLDGLRVLVIDDNEDAAEAVAWLLKDAGAEVQVAGDACNVMALVEEFDPTLVLLDLSLPKIDGYDACRLIKRFKGAMPLVAAVTGWSGTECRVRCQQAGFDVYLLKPVAGDDFIELGRAALRRAVLVECSKSQDFHQPRVRSTDAALRCGARDGDSKKWLIRRLAWRSNAIRRQAR